MTKIEPEDYLDRIPKLIHYVYDKTELWDTSYITLDWFKDPFEAKEAVKKFIDDGGILVCSLTNDYKRIKMYKDDWKEEEKTPKKQIQRQED